MRRLLDILTALCLLLSLTASGMWVRGQFVTEGWEFRPCPAGMIYGQGGWYRHRLLESGGGRLAYAEYQYLVPVSIPDEPEPSAVPATEAQRWGDLQFPQYALSRRRFVPNPFPTPPPPGYRQSAAPLSPDLRGRVPDAGRERPGSYGRIPGVVEWRVIPRYQRRFIAVSWLPPALAFAALPAFRGWRLWRRWRMTRRPGFPVETPAGSRQPHDNSIPSPARSVSAASGP